MLLAAEEVLLFGAGLGFLCKVASASAALKSTSITPCLDFNAKKLGIQLASEQLLQLLKTHCLFFFAFLGRWIPTAMSDVFFDFPAVSLAEAATWPLQAVLAGEWRQSGSAVFGCFHTSYIQGVRVGDFLST